MKIILAEMKVGFMQGILTYKRRHADENKFEFVDKYITCDSFLLNRWP